jgi:hypothetical protein
MKATEVVRFHCRDCQIVFDLCVDHLHEEVTDLPPVIDYGEPVCCPFCGARELTRVHDQAIRPLT